MRRRPYVALLAVATTVFAAGCGSLSRSSGNADSTSNGQEAVLVAAESSGLQKAQAAYHAALAAPSHLFVNTPLTTKPPAGKLIVALECTNGPSCAAIDQGETAAATAVGWKVKTLTFDDTQPSQFFAALTTALQYHPVATTFTALPYELWKTAVPAYQKAGVELVPITTDQAPVNKTILPVIDGLGAARVAGTIIGDWFVATSGGKGHALIASIPAYTSVSPPFNSGVEAVVKADCPACTVKVENFTAPEFDNQQIGGIMVDDARKDAGVNYILSGFGQFISGIDSALRTANLEGKIQVGTADYSSSNITGIEENVEQASTGDPWPLIGWSAVYEVLLHMEGVAIPSALNGVQTQLITKANVSTANPSAYDPPFNYASDFESLEKVK